MRYTGIANRTTYTTTATALLDDPTDLARSIDSSRPFAWSAARITPVIAPPAMSPDENNTPGPESAPGPSRSSAENRRSTSQRSTPPAIIVADVEIGRYTPTHTGSDGTPTGSRPPA